ncbi:hypothetical protein, partial [Mesorhizobium sp.]|uniref:hypothetical protein n=1 Tax=Mesorhizobium sp. TaxID=1871066 RepID=UPI0025DAAEDF
VQNNPSRRAANRVSKKIAAALAGDQTSQKLPRKTAIPKDLVGLDGLLQSLYARLLVEGIDALRVKEIVTGMIADREPSPPIRAPRSR